MSAVTLDEALRLVTARAPEPESRLCKLEAAHGRVLAADVVAGRDQPPFVSSAMDGYALILLPDEVNLTDPFRVIGESQAGAAYKGALHVGEAVRIFTGAPVPSGTTHVIMQENIEREGDTIRIKAESLPDGNQTKTHIRPQGLDFQIGHTLLMAGERLDAWRLSLAASAGMGVLRVVKKPRIAILCAGNELVPAGDLIGEDQIYESNSIALINLVKTWGGKPKFQGLGRDDLETLTKRLAHISADLIVTVGGASVGDYDLIKPALRQLGYQADFEKVDLRPGRPTSFGVLPDGRCVLGLPGNPASALVCAQLFLKAFIDKTLGVADAPVMQLPLAEDLPANGPREAFLRAQIVTDAKGQSRLLPFKDQDSALIQIFARSNALVRRAGHAPAAKAGDYLPFMPLARL
ncbi:MAG: molybdopterin molybdotransferase MoeA [Asticcacaulis sp.]